MTIYTCKLILDLNSGILQSDGCAEEYIFIYIKVCFFFDFIYRTSNYYPQALNNLYQFVSFLIKALILFSCFSCLNSPETNTNMRKNQENEESFCDYYG